METFIITTEFSELPFEIQQKIAINLDIQSVLNLCLGSKTLQSVIYKDDNFWRNKYIRDLNDKKVFENLDWLQNYRIMAFGIMNFEYDDDAEDIYIKIGGKIIITLPNIDPQIPRNGFLTLFMKNLSPRDILKKIDENLIVNISYQSTLEKNKDLIKNRKYVIISTIPDTDIVSSYIYLTKREAMRLISAVYQDYYIAFYM